MTGFPANTVFVDVRTVELSMAEGVALTAARCLPTRMAAQLRGQESQLQFVHAVSLERDALAVEQGGYRELLIVVGVAVEAYKHRIFSGGAADVVCDPRHLHLRLTRIRQTVAVVEVSSSGAQTGDGLQHDWPVADHQAAVGRICLTPAVVLVVMGHCDSLPPLPPLLIQPAWFLECTYGPSVHVSASTHLAELVI